MPKTKIVNKIKYQPVLKLPPLPADQYEALRANIAVNGVLVPISVAHSVRPSHFVLEAPLDCGESSGINDASEQPLAAAGRLLD